MRRMASNGGGGTGKPVDLVKLGQQIVALVVAAVIGGLLSYAFTVNDIKASVGANTSAIERVSDANTAAIERVSDAMSANAQARRELSQSVAMLAETVTQLRVTVAELQTVVRRLQ